MRDFRILGHETHKLVHLSWSVQENSFLIQQQKWIKTLKKSMENVFLLDQELFWISIFAEICYHHPGVFDPAGWNTIMNKIIFTSVVGSNVGINLRTNTGIKSISRHAAKRFIKTVKETTFAAAQQCDLKSNCFYGPWGCLIGHYNAGMSQTVQICRREAEVDRKQQTQQVHCNDF